MTCRQQCESCPLSGQKVMPGSGRSGGMMIIGEAPTQADASRGIPFSGQAGRVLRETLKAAGVNFNQVYVTHAVSCAQPDNKTPTPKMIAACRDNLMREIIEVNPSKILTLGTTPLKALFGKDAVVSKIRGLGQYVEVPVRYEMRNVTKWKAAWVALKDIEVGNPQLTSAFPSMEQWLEYCDTVDRGEYFCVGTRRKSGVYLYTKVGEQLEYRDTQTTRKVKLYTEVMQQERYVAETRRFFTVATYTPRTILSSPDLFREFAYDIEKFLQQKAPLPRPKIDTWIPRSVAEAKDALSYIASARVIGCDTETTGLDPHSATLLSIGFAALVDGSEEYDAVAVIIPRELVYDTEVVEAMRGLVDGKLHQGTLAFHNLKFDAQILRHAGYALDHPNLIDTMMLAYAWDERPSVSDEFGDSRGAQRQGRSLKTFGRIFYDIPNYHFDFPDFFERMDRGEVTDQEWSDLYHYHALDCVLTARLYFDLKEKLDAESPKLFPLARDVTTPACLTFADVEYRGIRIDVPYLEGLRGTYVGRADEQRAILDEFWQIKQLGARKKEGFSTGEIDTLLRAYRIHAVDTERDTLINHKVTMPKDDPRRDMIDALIKWRLNTKVVATYIDGILKRVGKDGRIHPQFVIDGTETGRLSSRNPNAQNIPSRTDVGKEIKRAFIPEEGMVFLQADYSQIQVRIAGSALFANEPKIRESYLRGDDIYIVAASEVYRKAKEAITKAERGRAKSVVLGTLFERTAYGIISGAEMAEMLDRGETPWTLDEAQAFQDAFFDVFPGLRAYSERQHQFVLDCLKRGEVPYVEDPLGRRRRFPFIPPGGLDHMLRQTGNSPIQAGEAEVVLTGMNRLHRIFKREKLAHIILSVHDSTMAEVYPENVERVAEITKENLEQSPFETDIPFTIEMEAGNTWANMIPVERWLKEYRSL